MKETVNAFGSFDGFPIPNHPVRYARKVIEETSH